MIQTVENDENILWQTLRFKYKWGQKQEGNQIATYYDYQYKKMDKIVSTII